MNAIGTYISNTIESKFRKFKFRRFGRDDVMTAYVGTQHGEDSVPVPGAKLIHISTTNSNENVIICTVHKADDSLNVGEKVIYSTDQDGNVKAKIYLRNDGTIEITGDNIVMQEGEDYAVKYSKLESEFNELKDKFNDLVGKWNTFATVYVPGGPSTQGLPASVTTATESTADITKTKVETIKLP